MGRTNWRAKKKRKIPLIASDSDSDWDGICLWFLDWPTILMTGNTLEKVRVARFGLID